MDSSNFRLASAIALLVVAVTLAYYWFLPRPLPGIPHNPVTSLLGDIPDITQEALTNGQSSMEYFNKHAKKYGPISQVG